MKLFTKEIDKKLFAQYPKGNNLEEQKVVAKIFNPYGQGRWYLLNSDPEDPDYLWAIVQMGNIVEIGSVSRKELESIRVSPFRFPLERDLGFSPKNAYEVWKGLKEGKFFREGGETAAEENKAMVLNQAEEFEHHAEELEAAAKKADHVPAWVVAKSERASTDLSDITHYLDGENEQKREEMEGEEEYAQGGELKWQDAQLGDSALVVSLNKMGVIIKPYGRKFHLKFADGTEKTFDASELKFFGDIDDFDRGGQVMADGGRTKDYKYKRGDEGMYKGKHTEVINIQLDGRYLVKTFDYNRDNFQDIEEEKKIDKETFEYYFNKFSNSMAEGGELRKKSYAIIYFPNGRKVKKSGYQSAYKAFSDYESEGSVKAELYKDNMLVSSYPNKAEGGYMAKGGKVYKIQVKDSDDLQPKWQDDTWYTGGKKYLSYAEAQKAVKKLQGDTAYYSKEFKVIEDKEKMADGGIIEEIKEFEKYNFPKPKTKGDKVRAIFEHLSKKGYSNEEINKALSEMKYAKGGKVKFADKVKPVKASLLKRKKVSPKVQKDYGKTYSPAEAEESANRIVGAMTAKERLLSKFKKKKSKK